MSQMLAVCFAFGAGTLFGWLAATRPEIKDKVWWPAFVPLGAVLLCYLLLHF